MSDPKTDSAASSTAVPRPGSAQLALVGAAALGLVSGVASKGIVQVVGADPGAVAFGLALPLSAVALARHGAPRIGRVAQLILGVTGGVALASPATSAELVATIARAARLSPTQGLLALLVVVLVACTLALAPHGPRLEARPSAVLLAVLGLALGIAVPAWAGGAAIAAAALIGLRGLADDERAPPPPPAATLGLVALVLLAAWSVGFLWSALRAWLDPTPFGAWCAAAAAATLFGLGWAVGGLRSRRVGLEPLIAASGLVVTMAVLPLVVPRWAAHLPGSMLDNPPELLLPALLSVPGAVVCLLLGLAAPPVRGGDSAGWAVALPAGAGLVLGTQGGVMGAALLPLSAVLGGALVLLVAQRPLRRLAGLAAALAVSAVWWTLPTPQVIPLCTGWTASVTDEQAVSRHIAGLERADWELAGWGPEGTIGLRRIDDSLIADIDGFPLWFEGRNPAAVRFAAHLPALLARDPSRVLVLGDELGWATITLLAHGPDTIETAVSQPELMRAVAATSDDVKRALLAPEIRLQPVPASWMLRSSPAVDSVLWIQLRPRADAGGPLMDPSTLELASRRLLPGGLFVGLLATDRLPRDELQAVLEAFATTFPAGAACIPPQGADHLVLLGPSGGESPPLARMQARFDDASAALGLLGITSPLDIADRCVIPAQALASWQPPESRARPRLPYGLPGTIGDGFEVPLSFMGDLVAAPDEIWDLAGAEDALPELERRYEAVRQFLALLGETGSGDLEGLFERAKALQASADGSRELETLVSPHLARAREAMERARQGGPQHRDWQQALNELTLARMLHPASLDAKLLEAMVHEARSEHRRAEALYRSVLESQPEHLQAHFGLARIQIVEGRETEAIATLEAAVEFHPREVAAHQVLGVALMRFERYDDAEPALRKAAALAGPDEAKPQAALAELFLAQGRPVVAQAHAELAVRIAPSAYHYTLLGRCHQDLGRKVPAERAFHQAVLLDSEFFPPRFAMARIYAERGDYAQAEGSLLAVLAIDNGNDAALANLAEIQRLMELERADPRIELAP